MSLEQCAIIHVLSSNLAYQLVIAVKFSLCAAGACGICYQWSKQGVRFLVHDNTKVLFRLYYALNLCVASFFAITYLIELTRLRFECAVLSTTVILLTKCMGISTLFSAHHVMVIISIERLYSSLYPAHFEKHSSKKFAMFLGVNTTILTWVFSINCMSGGFVLFQPQIVALYDAKLPMKEARHKELMIYMSYSNVLSLCMLFIDVYLNFIRKPVPNTSLGISYQMLENRRIILTILPIELSEYCLTLFTTTALIMLGKLDISTPVHRHAYIELVTLPQLFPLVLTFLIEFRVGRRSRDVVTKDNAVDAFENLRRFWGH